LTRLCQSSKIATAICGIVGASMAASSPFAANAHDPQLASTSTPESQVALALAYEHGEGMPKDQKIAAAIYCEMAARGSGEAAFQLAWMYAYGRGVPHDDGVAVALFQLAAGEGAEGARRALQNLGGPPALLPECMRPIAPAEPREGVVAEGIDTTNPFESLPPAKQKIADLVKQIAPRYGIDPRLALSIIAVESNFDALAHSVKDAQGLMQLIPETAARFNVRNPFDIRENLRGGLMYLRWLLAYYRGQVALASAAYNAGEHAVDHYRGVPPFPETRAYVRRVLELFHGEQHPYDPAIAQPSAVSGKTTSAAN
jgi:transglycosylase-like protein with SLT domain/Sel1 repeat-containing protein